MTAFFILLSNNAPGSLGRQQSWCA